MDLTLLATLLTRPAERWVNRRGVTVRELATGLGVVELSDRLARTHTVEVESEDDKVCGCVVDSNGEHVEDAYAEIQIMSPEAVLERLQEAMPVNAQPYNLSPGGEPVGLLTGTELPQELRGIGLGRRMMNQVIDEARDEHDIKLVWLISLPTAVGFWDSMGFIDSELGHIMPLMFLDTEGSGSSTEASPQNVSVATGDELGTMRVQMDPDVFLRLTGSSLDALSMEMVQRYTKIIERIGRFDAPLRLELVRDEGPAWVALHDGRHRSRAAALAGLGTVPVILEGPSDLLEDIATGAVTELLSQPYDDEEIEEGYLEQAMVPLGLETSPPAQQPSRLESMTVLNEAPVVLYHGTTIDRLDDILEHGLRPHPGRGWEETEGVYLSGSIGSARYWSMSRLALDMDLKGEAHRYEREHPDMPHVVILKVTIPAEGRVNLRADMEQAEDVGFEGGPMGWQQSLTEIGDVMYDGPIPSSWIEVIDTGKGP
jgi:hypothetical protein